MLAVAALASCGDQDWLKIKRPKFEGTKDNGSKNDSIYEDVDFNDPLVPDECTANEPDDIPEEVIAVEEETSYVVKATVYNPDTAQCNGNPLVTACNSRIDLTKLKSGELRWLAVSRDLLDVYSYGDTLNVFVNENHPYNGQWVVKDTMNKRYTYSIDFLTYDTKYGKWDAIITKV